MTIRRAFGKRVRDLYTALMKTSRIPSRIHNVLTILIGDPVVTIFNSFAPKHAEARKGSPKDQ